MSASESTTYDVIPVSKPCIGALEIKYVTDAVTSGWVSSLGSYIDTFEEEFASFVGTRHALAVSNGTVGLQLALSALGIRAGQEVIIPDLTFVATANAVLAVGGVPVQVDIDPFSYCINVDELKKAINENTFAVIPVHLYGMPANMPSIRELCIERGVRIVEDAAEAHGATISGKQVGSFGDIGVFSFYGNKIITSGEGGMLTTNSPELLDRAKCLRDHAMSAERRYWHNESGFNFRMTNLQAALGLAQLRRIGEFLECRERILHRYKSRLSSSALRIGPALGDGAVNWLVTAQSPRLDFTTRDRLITELRKSGVDTRPFFYPIGMLPFIRSKPLPVALRVSGSSFNLPTFVGLTDSQIDFICNVLLAKLEYISDK